MTQPVQPIFIMSENTKRDSGREAQKNNIMAAKLVAETVRTTLGPKGMDKMLVDSMGDVVVTNDGVTILEEMEIEHPAAKMVVEIAKTQEDEIGDGTTTAVVLAGEMLKKAENLLEQNIHPTVLIKGYRMASTKAIEILNEIAEKIDVNDKETLKNIAMTAMTGKGAEVSKEILSEIVVESVLAVKDENNKINKDYIKIEKKSGESIENTELIKGVVIDKEKVNSEMPKKIENAKILLLDIPIEIKSTEMDAKIQITDPSQMQAFIEQEENMIKEMVEKIEKTGANVVLCQKGIDDIAQYYLAKKNIYAIRRVKRSDLEAVSRATGAKIFSNLNDVGTEDLGFSGIVEERKIGDEYMTFINQCKHPKAVTILMRGATEHVVEEAKRAIEDAIGDVSSVVESGSVVGGAGAIEIELSTRLKKFASSLSGREQLAVQSFAESFEVIPKTLAENAGLDPIDVLTNLKSKHEQDEKWAGIDVFTGEVMNSWDKKVIEPLKIKTQAIESASEVAVMILRIDDIIAVSPKDKGGMGNMNMGGMPPQM